MHIQISGQRIDTGDALRVHVTEKLNAGVAKYFDQPLDAGVTFSRGGEGFACSISIHVFAGLTLFADARAGDIYSAFDEAADRIEKRLRRHKNRLKDHKGKGANGEGAALEARYYVIGAPDEEDDADGAFGAEPAIIAETPSAVSTLSVADAVVRLDISGGAAMMFRNAGNGGLNVVYRRPDGNIGWIDPSFDPTPN